MMSIDEIIENLEKVLTQLYMLKEYWYDEKN